MVVYPSTVPSNTLLMVDASLYSASATLVGARTSFSTTSNTITRRFVYDHAGRLLETWHKVNDEDSLLLAKNEYNELGELVAKKLHSTDENNFKQQLDYRYNIRGWMTRINESDLSKENINDASEPKDYFGMNLLYNQVDPGLGNADLYNGNISATKWSTNLGLGEPVLNEAKERSYKFTYDPLNRLTAATHVEKIAAWTASNSFHEDNLTYDQNGNIKSLNRKGSNGTSMDILSYNYGTGTTASNKLLTVTDAGDREKGFTEVGTAGTDYVYDANGNLIWDRNKGGTEAVTNGSFESGSSSWTITDTGARLSFANNEVQIVAGTVTAEIKQAVIVKSKPYVVVIDIERTAGTLTVNAGGTTSNLTSTGQFVLSMTAGNSHNDFRLTAGTTFAGKIKSVSVKGVTVITYNFLNLPEIVTKAGDKQLQFIYDATGRKLSQELSKNNVVEKRTDYNGEFIYENDTLQFIQHEEGRVNMIKAEPIYEYVLRDHLGNTRITFTTKHETETFTATLEDNTQTEEESNFENYSRVTADLFDHTDAGTVYDKALLLHGGNNSQIGLAKSFAVVPGDTIKASVYAKYFGGTGGTSNLVNFAAALTGAFGLSSASTGEAANAFSALNSYGAFISSGNRDDDENAPKGFINILVFNEDYELVDFAYHQIDASFVQIGETKMPHQLLSSELAIRQAGYAYVFLSNEGASEQSVYFDDYSATHAHSDVIQAAAFYPFGLTFDDYQKEGSLRQRWKFQKQEHIEDMDLGWVQFKWRNAMPEIGRFFNVDPISERYYYNSVYAFSENHVTAHIELEGLEKASINELEGTGQTPNPLQPLEGPAVGLPPGAGKVVNGLINTTLGGVGIVASVGYIATTDGLGTLVGGGTALTLSLGETSIGIMQVVDGVKEMITGEGLPASDALQGVSTIPGLMATGSENAQLIDAAAGLAPGALTGGNLKTILESPSTIRSSSNSVEATFNVLNTVDATLDVKNAVHATVNTVKSNSNNDSTKRTKEEVKAIANYVDSLNKK